MTLDLSQAEIALIQRAVGHLLLSGWMTKPEKPVANDLLNKLGVGWLPTIRGSQDAAPAMEEHGLVPRASPLSARSP